MRSRREGRRGIDHADPNMVDEVDAKKAEEWWNEVAKRREKGY